MFTSRPRATPPADSLSDNFDQMSFTSRNSFIDFNSPTSPEPSVLQFTLSDAGEMTGLLRSERRDIQIVTTDLEVRPNPVNKLYCSDFKHDDVVVIVIARQTADPNSAQASFPAATVCGPIASLGREHMDTRWARLAASASGAYAAHDEFP
jgi:hypothetical protein